MKVLVSHENSNIDIRGETLQCLMLTRWLNDEVVPLLSVSRNIWYDR